MAGAGGTIFFKNLLVFGAADVAAGVNHSDDSDRHAAPWGAEELGRRED